MSRSGRAGRLRAAARGPARRERGPEAPRAARARASVAAVARGCDSLTSGRGCRTNAAAPSDPAAEGVFGFRGRLEERFR